MASSALRASNDSSSKMSLQELILSSSSTLTCLHDLKTGSLQTSLKGTSSSGTSDFSTDPQASSSSTYGNNSSNNNSNAKGKNRAVEEEQSSLFMKTTDCIETRDAVGGIVASVIAGKAAINIWSYQKVRTLPRCVILILETDYDVSVRRKHLCIDSYCL